MFTVISLNTLLNRDVSEIVVAPVYELPDNGNVRVTLAIAPAIFELADIRNLNSVCSSLGFGMYH
tara:strand:- start:13 stop:207 length:195 start_codon:yes stop_codon:yes gene_type:complete